MRLVLDTNTVINGLLWQSHSFHLLNLAQKPESGIEIHCSAYILNELNRVLRSSKLERYLKNTSKTPDILIPKFVSMINHVEPVDIINPPDKYLLCEDPDDNLILGTALAARADILVTGDGKLLKMSPWEGIEILNAKDTLTQLAQGRNATHDTIHETHPPYNAGVLGIREPRAGYGLAQAA